MCVRAYVRAYVCVSLRVFEKQAHASTYLFVVAFMSAVGIIEVRRRVCVCACVCVCVCVCGQGVVLNKNFSIPGTWSSTSIPGIIYGILTSMPLGATFVWVGWAAKHGC